MTIGSCSTEGPPLESLGTYGYIWADWLYGYDKDTFMVDVYNKCKDIDGCTDSKEKTAKLLLLRNKVQGSRKSWVDGIVDFIEFESQLLPSGVSSFDTLSNVEDYRAMEILHAAYIHGAFRGLCRTPSGAEWIGQLGEFCAAAVHQGFKWVRVSGGVSNWELPKLGEPWCKGAVLWALVSMYIAVDIAGADPGNDAALERIHTVIQAHHFAGSCWLQYRGAHPHKWWSAEIRGKAPDESSIRDFGEKHGWPGEMINILTRGAKHVNSWKNPPFNPVFLERMRNLLIWDHTPRLKSRLIHVVDKLVQLEDNVTESEAEEILSRCASWISSHTAQWHGRGDRNDMVVELSILGAFLEVLRDSRTHVSSDLQDRAMAWSRERIGHLSPDMQDLLLGKLLRSIQVHGRLPRAVDGYGSEGSGHTRYVDGWWDVVIWISILSHPAGGREVPANMRELIISFFNVWTKKRRIVGRDIPAGLDEDEACPICIGHSIFEGSVDNRPMVGLWQGTTWGTLLYYNLGLGNPEDTDLGCR
jgi:hypothetical protein